MIAGDEIAISGSPDYDYYTAAYVTKEGIYIKGDAGEYGISPLAIPWAGLLKHAPAEALNHEYGFRRNERRLKEMLEEAARDKQ